MMTAPDTTVASGVLDLPEPVGKQFEWLDSPALRKVLRVGRRGSKTRFAFSAALAGHGPGWEDGTPLHRGVLQGGDVVWICPTYSNLSTVLWKEEIDPRMGHLPWVDLNKTTHDVNIPGLGSLMLRSGDRSAIDSVRGVGKRLFGVIVDEAAHMDSRGALLDVILPALLDNDGWLILMSTTNAAGDGGYDDTGAPQVPSYFNLICKQIRAGQRGDEWKEFTGTAYDNPTLDTKAIDALIAEYPPDSPKLKQEVFAELLEAGVGLALPNLTAERHLIPRHPVPTYWTFFGGFDWGFNHPWVFGWYACDTDGNVTKLDTMSGRGDLPDEICTKILSAFPAARPNVIVHAGHDIWDKKGKAIGFKGPTIAETMQQHGFRLIEANTSRVMGLNNLRAYTAIPADKDTRDGPVQIRPRFVWMDTDGNRQSLAQCQAMQIDPKDLEDALKIDADPAGRGGDDFYDETRYALMSRPLLAKAPVAEDKQGVALGYDYDNKKPRERMSAEQEVAQMLKRAQPNLIGSRYSIPNRRGR